MPMRMELDAPVTPQDSVPVVQDLLAVVVFCVVGLALSYSLIGHTNASGQIAELLCARPWSRALLEQSTATRATQTEAQRNWHGVAGGEESLNWVTTQHAR